MTTSALTFKGGKKPTVDLNVDICARLLASDHWTRWVHWDHRDGQVLASQRLKVTGSRGSWPGCSSLTHGFTSSVLPLCFLIAVVSALLPQRR